MQDNRKRKLSSPVIVSQLDSPKMRENAMWVGGSVDGWMDGFRHCSRDQP